MNEVLTDVDPKGKFIKGQQVKVEARRGGIIVGTIIGFKQFHEQRSREQASRMAKGFFSTSRGRSKGISYQVIVSYEGVPIPYFYNRIIEVL